MSLQDYKADFRNGISLLYTDELDGCGLRTASEIPQVLEYLYRGRVFDNCLEMWSGPGFFGFEVLSVNKCKNLTLVDFYDKAGVVVDKTIKYNKLDNVKFVLSDNFKSLPPEKFDLIIGNPPWFCTDVYADFYDDRRKYKDTDWLVHKDFFNNINNYLEDNGVILLAEHQWGCGLDTFKQDLEENSLYIKYHFKSKSFKNVWYMVIEKNES